MCSIHDAESRESREHRTPQGFLFCNLYYRVRVYKNISWWSSGARLDVSGSSVSLSAPSVANAQPTLGSSSRSPLRSARSTPAAAPPDAASHLAGRGLK